jgi:hypothetical protein
MRVRRTVVAGLLVLVAGGLPGQVPKPATAMSASEVAAVAIRAVDASRKARDKYVWASDSEEFGFDGYGMRTFHFQQNSRATAVDGVEYTLAETLNGHPLDSKRLETSRQTYRKSLDERMKTFDFDRDANVYRLPRLLATAFTNTVSGPEMMDGHSCVVLRSVPKEEQAVASIRVWVDVATTRLVRYEIVRRMQGRAASGFMRTTAVYGWFGNDDLEVSDRADALNENGVVSGSWKSTTTLSKYEKRGWPIHRGLSR